MFPHRPLFPPVPSGRSGYVTLPCEIHALYPSVYPIPEPGAHRHNSWSVSSQPRAGHTGHAPFPIPQTAALARTRTVETTMWEHDNTALHGHWEDGEDEQVEEEDEGEVYFELDQEWCRRFAETEQRRRKRKEERRRALDVARRTGIVSVGDTSTTTTADDTSPSDDARTSVRKGYSRAGLARVEALEARLNAVYDEQCDRMQPIVWPSAPLRYS